jgi:hypothetical protein
MTPITHSTSTRPAPLRRVLHLPTLVLVLVLAAAAPAAAQAPSPILTPGTRVRVESPVLGAGRTVRRVAVQRGDTLVLASDRRAGRDSVVLTIADVRSLEVSHGWRERAITGGVVGLVVGVAAGAIIGYNSPVRADSGTCGLIFCTGGREEVTRKEGAVLFGQAGAQAGAALGALFGRFVLGERWERLVPRNRRVGAAPASAPGIGLAVTFR